MFCIIKYSEKINPDTEVDKSLYINPDCAAEVLFSFIRTTLAIAINIEFDLCDINGDLKNVNELEASTNATEKLEHKHVYYVVLIEKSNEDGKIIKLTPLISKIIKQHSDLHLKLKRYVNPSKRFSFDLKKKRRSTTDKSGSVSSYTTSKSLKSRKP